MNGGKWFRAVLTHPSVETLKEIHPPVQGDGDENERIRLRFVQRCGMSERSNFIEVRAIDAVVGNRCATETGSVAPNCEKQFFI